LKLDLEMEPSLAKTFGDGLTVPGDDLVKFCALYQSAAKPRFELCEASFIKKIIDGVATDAEIGGGFLHR
jgi:hypothetical protein